MPGSTDAVPPEGGRPSRAGRTLAPVVWLLAIGWLGLQAAGRAGMWLLAAVDGGTAAVARGGTAGVRAVLRALGPLGRALRRLLTPALRGLRRAWSRLGRWVFVLMLRPLGRFGRWLVDRTRPAVDRGRAWVRAAAVRAEPALYRLAAATEGVERAAARLGRALRRAVAPLTRAARARRDRSGGPG